MTRGWGGLAVAALFASSAGCSGDDGPVTADAGRPGFTFTVDTYPPEGSTASFDVLPLAPTADGRWRASLAFTSWQAAEDGAPYAFVVRTPATGIDRKLDLAPTFCHQTLCRGGSCAYGTILYEERLFVLVDAAQLVVTDGTCVGDGGTVSFAF